MVVLCVTSVDYWRGMRLQLVDLSVTSIDYWSEMRLPIIPGRKSAEVGRTSADLLLEENEAPF